MWSDGAKLPSSSCHRPQAHLLGVRIAGVGIRALAFERNGSLHAIVIGLHRNLQAAPPCSMAGGGRHERWCSVNRKRSWVGTVARLPEQQRRRRRLCGGQRQRRPAPTWRVVCQRVHAPNVLARASVAAGQQACGSTGLMRSEALLLRSQAAPAPSPPPSPAASSTHSQTLMARRAEQRRVWADRSGRAQQRLLLPDAQICTGPSSSAADDQRVNAAIRAQVHLSRSQTASCTAA